MAGLEGRNEKGLRAVRVSSAETPKQQEAALDALREGRAEFLFITPEQLSRPDRLKDVKALKPSLVAVDEAHCISAWGHDFRPDYLALGHLIRGLGRPPVVALTATASPPVREDIVEILGLRDPHVLVTGLDRPNLFLEAAHCPSEEYRWRRLVAMLDEGERPGIVYVPTRRIAEEVADRLGAGRLPRRHGDRHAREAARGVPRRQGAGHGRHLGVRHGHRQAEHPLGRPPRAARLAGQLPAGDRPGRPRRRGRPRAAALARRGHRPAALLHRRRAGRGRAARARRAAARRGAARQDRPARPHRLRRPQARPAGRAPGAGGRRVDHGEGQDRQPALRAPARRRRRRGGRIGRAAAGRPAHPHRHDAGVRRGDGVPGPGAAGLLRRAAAHGRAGTATTATPAAASRTPARSGRSRYTARCGTPSGVPAW